MKTTKVIIFFTIISVILAISVSCNLYNEKTGSLSLNLQYGKNHKNKDTQLPEIDMSIDHYDIVLQGPEAETVSIENSSGSATIDDLITGEWSITASAINSENIPIGVGNETVEIIARQTVDCEIIVTPFDGFGGLYLSITWDTSSVQFASIQGALDPAIGSQNPIEFTLSNGENIYENTSLPIGYYILTIKLFDNETECGGAADVIRIVNNEITDASINIETSPASGGVGITIIPEMNDPIEIALTGTLDTVDEGNSFTVTAEAINTSDVIYSWFIDGALKTSGTDTDSYALPTDLNKGYHRLDVTIFTLDGLRGGSATHIFEVIQVVK